VKDLNALPLPEVFAELTRDGSVRRLLELARDEDLGPAGGLGDVTSLVAVDESAMGEAKIVARTPGIVAGLACVPEILGVFAPRCSGEPLVDDGKRVERGAVLGVLRGPVRELLAAERTLLNLVSRLSGVATRTAEFVHAISRTHAKLLDTRKTTPGLRSLEKYAVRCGGGYCHRVGLYDAVLIKDNHLAGVALGSLGAHVAASVARARELASRAGVELRFVEVEVDSIAQLDAILAAGGCGVDIVLLDNMSVHQLSDAVAKRARWRSRMLLEASGGVTLQTVRLIAETGVDRISTGNITHHAVSLDIGLDVAG
jgi:nicotinate-nucleotide pyrophosphorylase (carboxylating)